MQHLLLELSAQVERLLVARNPRGMQFASQHLQPGYYLRAARLIQQNKGCVLIGTGFPVEQTFETDGPVGAIYLYEALLALGFSPMIVCSDPLFSVLSTRFDCLELPVGFKQSAQQVRDVLGTYQPSLVLSIERPGLTQDGTYRNMFGADISERCGHFDHYIELANCPTIAIGDGGNEIGMGNISAHLTSLNVSLSATQCDELLVADVSNWGAYGVLTMLGALEGQCLLPDFDPVQVLSWLSNQGSVDGVTKLNTLTEDSLCYRQGQQLVEQLNQLSAPYWKASDA
ncbi:glutamate cyclase domain-containing protein [Thalassotalea sp. G2M2-11]|uniref:glutamate cyclase domain-containing protein n=1 Tax=Thalassotalea sp. G2M2-11 TaxID=2787627 RepID=UPI0019D12A17|nr:glutamate cyclase domain-containing protein [Thalassotalea sp. G2M2-11]